VIDTVHIVVAMKPIEGSFADNALKHGVAGINIDGCRVDTVDNLDGGAYAENPTHRAGQDMWTRERKGDTNCFKRGGAGNFNQPTGRWPSNVIFEHSNPVKKLDDRSGDQGGASRFFKTVNIFYD